MWPAVAMRASDTAAAAVGELVRAQAEAHELISSLVVFWEPLGKLTADERAGFADTIDALCLSMRQLRDTEERLFNDCETAVPPDDQLDWPALFAAIESERSSRDVWDGRLRALATSWLP